MYKAVIFDLDGTLLNTLDDLAASVNFALDKFDFPKRSTDEIRRFVGNGVIKLMQRATPDDIDEITFEKCFGCFREHYLEHMQDNTRPYDGVTEMLETLKKQGIKTAVVSNKLHSGVVELCKEFFGDNLTCSFGVEVEEERKPSPINVFKALAQLNVIADETIYVGDSEVDVQTATNACLDCIGVTWGFRDREELIEAGAKFIIDKPDEIKALIL
ncbi:MAG: HAD family hydrolase [Faecalibacterium sp.]|nr:HAD family hydrolase [Ruminococcus sp.]MCM1393005.1 HAD family hydrolase [Ruminococcus sp.]MCM1486515.1 HAD family hydrolase [Faecalibacterium sp.]